MKKKILKNWKTIEEIEGKVREETGDPKAGFNASVFWLNNNGRHLMIPCMYRKKKGKKGSGEFTSSYKEMMLYAQFCPFSGKPLYEDSLLFADDADAKLIVAAPEMLEALKEAQAALELCGGDKKIKKGDFVPSSVLAYNAVSKAIKKATE